MLDDASAMVSARTDKLAFQTATYGAVINSMLKAGLDRLPSITEQLCPLTTCKTLPDDKQAVLRKRLQGILA